MGAHGAQPHAAGGERNCSRNHQRGHHPPAMAEEGGRKELCPPGRSKELTRAPAGDAATTLATSYPSYPLRLK